MLTSYLASSREIKAQCEREEKKLGLGLLVSPLGSHHSSQTLPNLTLNPTAKPDFTDQNSRLPNDQVLSQSHW